MKQNTINYDVLVVGAGHAGLEAATAAARYGAKTLLITKSPDNIGELSCNPAIGGVGKGTLVKEIDALDGVMGRIADKATIHSKILNASKGPAVWGPRAQTDRHLYKEAVKEIIKEYQNLSLFYGEALEIILSDKRFSALKVRNTSDEIIELRASSLIITTGTFLNGCIHIGNKTIKAGRINENGSYSLADSLLVLKLPLGRLKTGTPPRVSRETIDYSVLEVQEGSKAPIPFSYLNQSITTPQIDCHITRTTLSSKKIIEDNLHLSAMYSGNIDAKGPRYCPSFEDKIVRFNDKETHQVFLEPESLTSDYIYPNGLSNSLPQQVQEELIHSIIGLENAKILQYGYAVAYDYINPTCLDTTLAALDYKGLYFAGQINGTTGYEEAGAQGLVAGVNAAKFAYNDPNAFTLDRSEAYIGVMISDLTERGVTEPYRMFTSRSEYRLALRQDNADIRLTNKGIDHHIVDVSRETVFTSKKKAFDSLISQLENSFLSAKEAETIAPSLSSKNGQKRSLLNIIGNKAITKEQLEVQLSTNISDALFEAVSIEAMYTPFLEKQKQDILLYQQERTINIPDSIDFFSDKMSLSNEIRSKLSEAKPKTINEAKRISGITPAAISALILFIKKKEYDANTNTV